MAGRVKALVLKTSAPERVSRVRFSLAPFSIVTIVTAYFGRHLPVSITDGASSRSTRAQKTKRAPGLAARGPSILSSVG
jgi:hypothetical protein